jgi:hypothetical protein
MNDYYLLDSVKTQILAAVQKGLCEYETGEKVDYASWHRICDRTNLCAAGFCEDYVEVKIKNMMRRQTLKIVYHCVVSRDTIYIRLVGSVFTTLVEKQIIDPKLLKKSATAADDLPPM